MAEVLIVPTGTANLASVAAAFRRLAVGVRLAERGREILSAAHVVLPGVGSFGAAMARLMGQGFVEALRRRIAQDRPTLAICVGHQLLFAASEESPGVTGLAVVPGTVRRFPEDVRVPQFGWNTVEPEPACRFVDRGWAYFANSYRATEAPGWACARSEHGGPFLAAIECGRVIGCQFHPELSGVFGAALLRRFLECG
ncbi:MAG: imidazole glycerol phosphate synthase subunit HisH [Geminicoccaceae bacterium]|nr:imidazole glycerol phosphate synthase subunit HisH [Geminicoccaceae bacterium]